MRSLYRLPSFAALVVGSSIALLTGVRAAPITYNVDLTVGGPAIAVQNTIEGMGSVVGSITTDGTIGGFTNTASITNWNLTLTDPAGTATINPSNSFVVFISLRK